MANLATQLRTAPPRCLLAVAAPLAEGRDPPELLAVASDDERITPHGRVPER